LGFLSGAANRVDGEGWKAVSTWEIALVVWFIATITFAVLVRYFEYRAQREYVSAAKKILELKEREAKAFDER
jgi:hypothetical protein